MSNHPIKIAIADDHEVLRNGLRSLISVLGNFQTIIEAGTCDDLIAKISSSEFIPDICILDINMPHKSGWQTALDVHSRWPDIKTLAFTLLCAKDIVHNLVSYPINGYLPKNCSAEELRTALLRLSCTGYYFSDTTSRLIMEYQKRDAKKKPSANEMEFLSYCCEDLTYKEIAERMNVGVRTIDTYRDALFEKLNIGTRQGLATYAIKCGLYNAFDK